MASVDSQKLVGVFVPRRRHDATIPDLLAERQLGTRMFRPSKTASTLSSAIAWNHNRLQNMILAVGPGTPAAALLDADPSSPSSSSDNESEHSEQEAQTMEQEAAHQREDDTEESESEEQALEENAPELARAMWFLRRQLESEGDSDMETDDEEDIGPPLPPGTVVSSIKHGGCINAACWLTCPWRLSIVGHEAGAHSVDCQEEHPTQLMTTGDDRVVKVWDVRYAMGSSNPLPGGHYMQAPFAEVSQPEPCCWKSWANRESPLSGSVIPLATLQTGHRNNIFHVTPVDHHPGKVATCGADGYLRISDLNAGPSSNSSVVVSADSESDNLSALLPAGLLSLRSSMCFSHHFLDANCGLLCSERGLKHFDIRSPPREQRSQSLLGNGKTCKSCAIWNAGAPSDSIESAYVFAGGSNADVTLFDLRMTDPDENRIVQRYRPSGIAPDAVSVSGLDISKDKRELLVSYENDQIYSFPIFPDAKSIAGPNLEEINECCRIAKDNKSHRVSELAAYGGHLNRFTFLKNAKYAGPNDEYICTGSDSGHAWIYERATGVVSSLLYADSSTCNGIIPHPTLPIFVTYGIDPTAKVWRATNPVDRDADDSPLGRARSYHKQEYTKSPIVQNYNCVAMSMAMDVDTDDDTTTGLLPDQLPPSDNANGGSITMGGILFQRRRFGLGSGAYSIGNNLRNLPAVLQKNYYDCAVAETKGEDKPVQSGLRELHRRISNIRLRHQADQRGLVWNSSIPWVFGSHKRYTVSKVINENMYGNPVDLIPDFPSDWIPFDPEMSPSPLPCGTHFNLKDHEGFYAEKFAKGPRGGDDILPTRKHPWLTGAETGPSVVTPEKKIGSTSRCKDSDDEEKEPQSASDFDVGRALHFLHETALLLKTGGNAALEAGSIREAARRYDRAIKYCSVALMDCGARNEAFHDQTARRWTPITKVLIMARLNLCMVLTRLEDTKGALDQATLAQQELGPFSKQRGKVLAGSRLEIVAREDEPDQTFLEAKELEAKACFRLGCVLMKRTEYEEAIESFEESISCTKEISKETEPSVLRRLAEAKREHTRKSKRQRKKFKRMFES